MTKKEQPRCKDCAVYQEERLRIIQNMTSEGFSEEESQYLRFGALLCRKKGVVVQQLCFCKEWEAMT